MCESAVAVLFCAADEAALCRPCDEKVRALSLLPRPSVQPRGSGYALALLPQYAVLTSHGSLAVAPMAG